jgi:plasmid stabilization system protein ParE
MAELDFRFSAEARDELRAACRYYEVCRTGLGDEFGHEVTRAIRRICRNATVGSPYAGEKVLRMHRFPYGVVYRLIDDQVLILAIAHLRRRPGYWKGRARDP